MYIKLFKISPALTDAKHNEMALLDTAASDPEKGDEMISLWLNHWQKHGCLSLRRQITGHFNMIHFVNHWEGGRDRTRIWFQRGVTILIWSLLILKKKKVPQNTLKLKPELFFLFLANSSCNHLSGLAGTLHKEMAPRIVESFSGLCLALNKAGPSLFPSSMERAIWMKLKNYLLKVRKGLIAAWELWNYLECLTNGCYNNKKGNYKMCTSQHAFKDTLHCAHIPLNVVPKGAQPLTQPE